MKLLTYDLGAGPRCGVLRDDSIVDVTALLGEPRTIRDVGALLALDEASVDRVGDVLAGGAAAPAVARDAVRLRSPILQPPIVGLTKTSITEPKSAPMPHKVPQWPCGTLVPGSRYGLR